MSAVASAVVSPEEIADYQRYIKQLEEHAVKLQEQLKKFAPFSKEYNQTDEAITKTYMLKDNYQAIIELLSTGIRYKLFGDQDVSRDIAAKKEAIKLSSGGFGTVSLITGGSGTRYYVKDVNKTGYNDFLTLLREIEINFELTRIMPKYVSKILNAGIFLTMEERVRVRFVFEYLPGADMLDYVNNLLQVERRWPTYEEASFLYCKTKKAIEVLHSNGYIHRDIKPENIFVVVDDDNKPVDVKLIDFGFVEKITPGKKYSFRGTKDYTPYNYWGNRPNRVPFQGRISPSNDIYPLGIIWSDILGQSIRPKPDCVEKLPNSASMSPMSVNESVSPAPPNLPSSSPMLNNNREAKQGGKRRSRRVRKTRRNRR